MNVRQGDWTIVRRCGRDPGIGTHTRLGPAIRLVFEPQDSSTVAEISGLIRLLTSRSGLRTADMVDHSIRPKPLETTFAATMAAKSVELTSISSPPISRTANAILKVSPA